MRAFLTALLGCSISMSLVTFICAAALPLLSKRYAAQWRYLVWLVVATGWEIPFRLPLDFPFLSVSKAAAAVLPMGLIPPDDNMFFPPLASAGDIGNAPAGGCIWWVLAAAWIAGACVAAACHILRHGRFLKIVRRWSQPVKDEKWLEIWGGLKTNQGISTRIGLYICPGIISPMLTGFFRPAVLLPPVRMAEDELTFVLQHELIHFKRHDLWYKALILLATVLHWFNPAVYLMARMASQQCEISCDAEVLGGAESERRSRYGETIISAARRSGAKRRTALSADFYGGKREMKRRMYFIMDTGRKKTGLIPLCAVVILMLITGSAFAEAGGKADTDWRAPDMAHFAFEVLSPHLLEENPAPEPTKPAPIGQEEAVRIANTSVGEQVRQEKQSVTAIQVDIATTFLKNGTVPSESGKESFPAWLVIYSNSEIQEQGESNGASSADQAVVIDAVSGAVCGVVSTGSIPLYSTRLGGISYTIGMPD